MSFQTSCMVLVRDEQQQIKLEKWVKGIGRQIIGGKQDWSNFFLADTDQTCFWLQLDENDLGLFDQDFYNCDENIEMFKALAAHRIVKVIVTADRNGERYVFTFLHALHQLDSVHLWHTDIRKHDIDGLLF